MTNENSYTLTGNLVKDPIIRETKNKVLVTATIAHNHTKDSVSYFDVEAWNDSSNQEVIKNAKKGMKLTITGYLKQDRWEDEDKKINSKVKLIASSIAPYAKEQK